MAAAVERTNFNKKDIFRSFLQCWNTSLFCKIEDQSRLDEDDDFLVVYAKVITNTPCPNGHKPCNDACGHAEANLVRDLDKDQFLENLLGTCGDSKPRLLTIMINNSPCRKCSDKLVEFYKYYERQLLHMRVVFANVYKAGQRDIPDEIKRGLIKLHKAGVQLEALSIDLEKPFFGTIDDAIGNSVDLSDEQKAVLWGKLDSRREKDERTFDELEKILASVDDDVSSSSSGM